MIAVLYRPLALLRARPDFARVTFVNFLFFMQFASGFVYPKWLLQQGFAERGIGLVMGSAGVATLVTTLLLARYIDRMSRLQTLRWGIAALIAATLVLRAASGSLVLLCVARSLQGAAFAASFMTAGSLATDYAPLNRTTEALGLFGIFTLVTHALSPLLAERFVQLWGWDGMFLVTSAYSVLAWGLSWQLEDLDQMRDDRAHPRPARWTQAEMLLLLLTAMVGIAFGTMVTYLPVWSARLHVASVGVFFASYASTAIGVRIFFGHLGDRLEKYRIVGPAALAVGLCCIILAAGGERWLPGPTTSAYLLTVGVLYGLGHGFFYPNANVQYLDIRPADRRGESMSHFMLAFNVGGVVAGMFLGSLIESVGYPITYAICAVAVFAALVAYWQAFSLRGVGARE